jgi:hypothetical protein
MLELEHSRQSVIAEAQVAQVSPLTKNPVEQDVQESLSEQARQFNRWVEQAEQLFPASM